MHAGVEAPVERLEGDFPGLPGRGAEFARFLRVRGDGLLDQDVLAFLQRRERPFVVQAVGEGDVDGVDVRGGNKRVVRSIRRAGGREEGFVRGDLGFRSRFVARGDASDDGAGVRGDRVEDGSPVDGGGGEDADAEEGSVRRGC